MPTYQIQQYEIHAMRYRVEAASEAEAIAKLIYDVAKRLGFPVTTVRLWETDHSFATYRPSR